MLHSCPYPIGYFYKRDDAKRLIRVPKGCGRWDCPYCGPRKKKKLLDRLASYYAAHPDECRFLTLTVSDKYDDEEITHAWARLRASLRKYGIRLVYLWVKEFTKRGRRHLHVIINRYIPKVLLEKLWLKATDYTSRICKITRRPVRSAAGYLSKYITKDVQNEKRYNHGERRYTFSRDFALPRAAKDEAWAFQLDYGMAHAANLAALREALTEYRSRSGATAPPDPGPST